MISQWSTIPASYDLLPEQIAIKREHGLSDRAGQLLILEDLRQGLGVRPNVEDRVRHRNK